MGTLKGKTLFITGGSRGIGKAIAMRAAKDGAHIIIAAKTVDAHPKLPGTIHTAAADVVKAGGQALAVKCDIRREDDIENAVAEAVAKFGGIDILVNNASAIQLTGTEETPLSRYDLMHNVNVRGTYACIRACLPHLKGAENPHILNISPPLNMNSKWFKNHVAYTMTKYGMSMCVLGMAEEFSIKGIGVNALWPQTIIETSALNVAGGSHLMKSSRKPEVMADAAHVILTRSAKECSGNFYIDETVLRQAGMRDFEKYAVTPGGALHKDFFLD